MDLTIEMKEHGGCLEIRGNPRLTFSDLAPTPLRMLEACPAIPHVLPVSVVEVDLEVVLRYPLQGLYPLAETLESRPWSFEDRFRFLMEISKTLDECGQYLLRSDHFCLDPERIYIGETPSEVKLVYMPLKNGTKRDVRTEFTTLVRMLFKHAPHTPDVENLCASVEKSGTPFADVKKHCLARLRRIADQRASQETGQSEKIEVETQEVASPTEALHSKKRKGIGWAVFALGSLWGWWWQTQSETIRIICITSTCLFLSGIYAPRIRTVLRRRNRTAAVHTIAPDIGPSLPMPVETRSPADTEHLPLRSDAHATVMLGHASYDAFHGVLVIRNGQSETAVVWTGKPRFVVGREEGLVDFCDRSLGVSRFHAEFVREGDRYYVRDLGSRNGTLLNGILLEPKRLYELADGDRLRILRTEIVFRR